MCGWYNEKSISLYFIIYFESIFNGTRWCMPPPPHTTEWSRRLTARGYWYIIITRYVIMVSVRGPYRVNDTGLFWYKKMGRKQIGWTGSRKTANVLTCVCVCATNVATAATNTTEIRLRVGRIELYFTRFRPFRRGKRSRRFIGRRRRLYTSRTVHICAYIRRYVHILINYGTTFLLRLWLRLGAITVEVVSWPRRPTDFFFISVSSLVKTRRRATLNSVQIRVCHAHWCRYGKIFKPIKETTDLVRETDRKLKW